MNIRSVADELFPWTNRQPDTYDEATSRFWKFCVRLNSFAVVRVTLQSRLLFSYYSNLKTCDVSLNFFASVTLEPIIKNYDLTFRHLASCI